MHDDTIIALSGIGLASIICQWFSWWVKLPAILALLVVGIIAGPVSGWLNPEAVFGDLLFPMVSLSVAVILFEGSLTLKFDDIRDLQHVVRNLLTVGIAITWCITTLAVHALLDFSWALSLLFGAIMVVTGPTVIVPMLRTVRPNVRVSNILRWEGIAIDPLGAILAVLVYEYIISGTAAVALAHTLLTFGRTLIVGLVFGSLAGYAFGFVLRRHWLPEYLRNVAALALVFSTFSVSNAISAESGLLTVTVLGVWLANMDNVGVEDILDFKESLSVLLISGLFIILAARVNLEELQQLGSDALAVFLIMQFIARPAKVFASAWRSSLTWQEKVVIGWIGPRGIVAAAVSALFALRLEQEGYDKAELLVPLAFSVIIGTVLLQGLTARPLARKLGVAEPENRGFLIVGGNTVARAVAKALKTQGFHVKLADSSWENISAARMEGYDTYFGNPVSEHADRHLDLIGLGQMLALTPQQDLNALACLRYRPEFGDKNVFTLATGKEKSNGERASRGPTSGAAVLFGDGVTFAKLASLLGQGATIRQTKLSDSFDFQTYTADYGRRAIPLFAISPKGHFSCFIANQRIEPQAGWIIIALVRVEDKSPEPKAAPAEAKSDVKESAPQSPTLATKAPHMKKPQ